MNSDIQEAKRLLALPQLMGQLGFGDRAKKSARCPFHLPDRNPSFGIFQGDNGQWFWKCMAGCGHGDEIDFLAKAKGIDVKEATKEFLRMAGVESKAKPTASSAPTQPAATEPKPARVQPRPLGEILDTVVRLLRRWVVFPLPEQPEVIALWVAHTWVLDGFDYTPYLHIFSAETSSGKSRLLEVLALLVNKPWKLDSGSVATIFRKIDSDKPTVLYDEIDNVFRGSGKDDDTKDLRACLNSGFKRDGKFARCVGQNANLEVKEFATFSPKALSGIGKVLSDTLSNRCIPIELQRQSRGQKAERFREREAQAELAPLRAELEAWSQTPGIIDALRSARPTLPQELSDRQMDITEPILAIADMAGGDRPVKARAGIIKLCTQGEPVVSIGVQLLAAIREIFEQTGEGKLTTRHIIEQLVAIEDGPWAFMFEDALKHDKLQTAASKLARKLKPYKTIGGEPIQPRVIKLADGSTPRGYHKEDFRGAWERYLPTPASIPLGASTSATSATYEGKTVAPSQSGCTEPQTNAQAATKLAREVAAVAPVAPLQSMLAGTAEHDCLTSTNGFWHLCEDCERSFNSTKTVYAGDWIRLYPDEVQPRCLDALRQALARPCEVCEESLVSEPYVWFHRLDGVAQCPTCRETQWWADGYEITAGIPSCRDQEHTRDQRIAERNRNQIQKAAQYRAQKAGLEEWGPIYQALLAQEPERTRRMIELLAA